MEKINKINEKLEKLEKLGEEDNFEDNYAWYKEYWKDLKPVIDGTKSGGNFFFNLNNNLLDILYENSGDVEKLKKFLNELEESINSLSKNGTRLRNMLQQII